MRGYSGRGSGWPDAAEWASVALLAVIGLWGAWFGVQSLLSLWWPINMAYFIAGAVVATVSALVARALLRH